MLLSFHKSYRSEGFGYTRKEKEYLHSIKSELLFTNWFSAMETSSEPGDGFKRFQLFFSIGDLVVCARSLHTFGAHGGLFCSGAGSGSSRVMLAVPACRTAALVAT